MLYRKGDSADMIKVRILKGEIIILKYTGGAPILISLLKFFFFFKYLIASSGTQDLSSPARDQTHVPAL